jgi:hypothetical protein
MDREASQRVFSQGRKQWIAPSVRRIEAGSAELDVGLTQDGPDDSS